MKLLRASLWLVAFASCAASPLVVSAKATSGKGGQQRVVPLMDLETMFPDPKVRALASAAGEGRLREVERLVAEGVKVNSLGRENATPLFWALSNLSGFRRLLELGADPNARFGDNGEGGSVMHWAARAEDVRFLEALLKHGGDPNLVAGMRKNTPLFFALTRDERAIDLLLDHGADINARSANGDTLLIVAAVFARFDRVYLLLERGADYEARNERGVSLADTIAMKRRLMDPNHDLGRWMNKVIRWLHDRGVEIPK